MADKNNADMIMASTIGERYQQVLKDLVLQHKEEFRQYLQTMTTIAEKLGLSDELKKIWKKAKAGETNLAEELRKFAEQHDLSEEFHRAIQGIIDLYETILAKGYSQAWTPDEAYRMRLEGSKLKEAYGALLRGDYITAAEIAGIDPNNLKDKPLKDAMSIIAKKLVGTQYEAIIGKAKKHIKISELLEETQ